MAYQAPYLLAYAVGIVFVFLRRRRAPKAAALALTALTLMFLSGFVGSALQGCVLADVGGQPVTTTSRLLSMIGLARGVLTLIALGLLIAAVFAGRPRPASDDAD